MKILFVGSSSEIAKRLLKTLNFEVYGISRKNYSKYKKVYLLNKYNLSEIKKVIKKIDIKFDNVFIFNGAYQLSLLKYFNIKRFNEDININFSSSILIINNLIKENKIKNRGSINFISSHAGIYPEVGNAYYSISKNMINFAIAILTKEYKKSSIRFNSLLVGFIKTKMSSKILDIYSEKQKIKILKKQNNKFISIKKLTEFIKKICNEKKYSNKKIYID